MLRRTAGAAIALTMLATLAGCGTAPSAPDSFGEWVSMVKWAADLDNPQAVKNVEVQQAAWRVDEEHLRDAYGTAATVMVYERNDLEVTAVVRVVSTQALGYFVPAARGEVEALAATVPAEEIQTFGDVTCDVIHPLVLSVESEENAVSECMRRNADLTLWMGPVANMLPSELAAATEEAWTAFGGSDDSPIEYVPSDGGDQAAVVMPSSLGPYIPVAEAPGYPETHARQEGYLQADGQALSDLTHAEVGAQFYTTSELDSGFSLYAYRLESAAPFVAYADPERLGMLRAPQEVVDIGEVQCMVTNQFVEPEGDPANLNPETGWCFRSGEGLTVFADLPFGGMREDPAALAAALDQAWEQLLP